MVTEPPRERGSIEIVYSGTDYLSENEPPRERGSIEIPVES